MIGTVTRRYVYSGPNTMWHFPATGVAGLDLYAWDTANATWRWLATTHTNTAAPGTHAVINDLTSFPACGAGVATTSGTPPSCATVRYRLHLPLYNGVADLRIGFRSQVGLFTLQADAGAAAAAVPPVVWYGTSIAQGGVASRPGMAFTNIIGRRIGRE